jgi:SSS family solute:Na+ symporter
MDIQIIISIVISFLIGIFFTFRTPKKKQTSEEYYTAKGLLNKNLIFFSVFATTFSAFTVVGLPAMFLTHGIGTFLFMGVGIILTPLTLHFIGRKIIRKSNEEHNHATPVGLLTSGYNSKAITIVLSTLTILVLFPYFILQIAGIGKFLVSVSNGNISYVLGCIICCLIVAPYIYKGGAKADADTDRIQGIILIACSLVLGAIILYFANLKGYDSQIGILDEKGLLSIPGPKGYFTAELLISYGIIFTLISISTPQVSQKLMGIKKEEDLNPLLRVYPFVGIIIVIFAGLIGFYAAANLKVSSPDFVSGDVLRSLSESFSTPFFSFIFFIISILFMSGVISAAVSTIDSLILTITGIIKDEVVANKSENSYKSLKVVSVFVILIGILAAAKPPLFIVSLAQIQLAGLTGLLPCLLGSIYGFDNKYSGWFSLVLGIFPLLLNKISGITYGNWEIGIICLFGGIVGLILGKIINSQLKK